MLRLRGHHLICLHFFEGEGYNVSFIKNLRGILEMVKEDDVEVSSGADDICMKCPHLKDDRCLYNEDSDEDIRRMDKGALDLLDIDPGTRIGWQKIRRMLPERFHKWYATECIKCDWRRACEKNSLYQQLKGSE